MKLQFALPLLIVCLVFANCSETDNGNQEPFVITSETEYEVYRAVIEDMYVHDDRKLIVIKSQTSFNPNYIIGAFESPDILSISAETLDSFQKRNQQPQAIDCTQLALSVPCKVLDQKAFDAIFTEEDEQPTAISDNWDRFYEEYSGSGGIVEVSKVGFNNEGNEALIYVGRLVYDLAGAGFHVLLVKKGDTWVIHSKEMTWIS